MAKAVVRPFKGSLAELPGRDKKWSVGEDGVPLSHVNPPFAFVLLQHGAEEEDGTFKPLYVHPYRFEGAGGAFLPVKFGCVGLQCRDRKQTRDMAAYLRAFPSDIDGMVKTLGRYSYEVPHGYGDLGEDGGTAAVREAGEETGHRIAFVRSLGEVCDNTAQSPHLIAARCGILGDQVATEDPDPAVRELPKVEYFDMRGILQLRRAGLLYCGITMSVVAAYQFSSAADPVAFPPLR